MTAVCDVKAWMRERAQKRIDTHYKGTGCGAYNDYRKLLERKDVDVVLVGDSLGMVIQGHDTTVPVSMEDMV